MFLLFISKVFVPLNLCLHLLTVNRGLLLTRKLLNQRFLVAKLEN